MKFAAKKECSALLAFLGEENWRSANIQKGSSPFAQVSWVDGHIVTVRQAGGHLLLRVGVALAPDQGEIVERLLETASMQEAEDYVFSAQGICNFLLVEVSGYIQLVLDKKGIEEEYRKMCKKLNDVLRTI